MVEPEVVAYESPREVAGTVTPPEPSPPVTTSPVNMSWGEPGVIRRTGGLTEFSFPRNPHASSAEQAADLVSVLDAPVERLRRPSDMVTAIMTSLGAVLILIMAVYAHGTTAGVAEDVRGFSDLLATILFVPTTLLVGLITTVVPLGVIGELLFRRSVRQAVATVIGGVGGFITVNAVTWAIKNWGTDDLIDGVSIAIDGTWVMTIPVYIGGVAGMLTAAAPRSALKSVKWSWNLVWVGLGVLLITAQVSLPGVLVALLVGRSVGLVVRYFSGVESSRAYGAQLIAGIRQAGHEPRALVRVPDVTDAPGGLRFISDDPALSNASNSIGSATQALARFTGNRVYAMTTTNDEHLDVVVLDGDRQVLGVLSRLWRSIRVRGIERQSGLTLRAAAERAALLSLSADVAGVRTPRVIGVGESQDSMILVQEHTYGAVALHDLPDAMLSDDMLREMWRALRRAHSAGMAHRSVTSDAILIRVDDGQPLIWLNGWTAGEIATSDVVRRIDLAQLACLLALRVGAERTMATAVDVLPAEDIRAMGPLLQPVILPESIRLEIRANKELLSELREALIARLPSAEIEPQRLRRFDARTIIMSTLVAVAGVVILTTLNFQQVIDAVRSAEPWWVGVAFALGLLSWFGSALTLVAFSPARLPMSQTLQVQAASNFVALAAPAGVGPAALNLRLLTRNGVATSLAVATVALVQLSQVIVTLVLLLVLSLFTGNSQLTQSLPSESVTYVVIGVAVVLAILMAIPAVRRWVTAKVKPTLTQVWPRLIQILGQPKRLLTGFAGNIIMTMTYVLAFQACLAAFDQQLSLIQVAIIYLLGNTAGAAVPTPGGLGAVEFALIGALTSSGVPAPIAASTTILFRALTYWGRIPLGWIAMRRLQREGVL